MKTAGINVQGPHPLLFSFKNYAHVPAFIEESTQQCVIRRSMYKWNTEFDNMVYAFLSETELYNCSIQLLIFIRH